jgi:hypothetical protein
LTTQIRAVCFVLTLALSLTKTQASALCLAAQIDPRRGVALLAGREAHVGKVKSTHLKSIQFYLDRLMKR